MRPSRYLVRSAHVPRGGIQPSQADFLLFAFSSRLETFAFFLIQAFPRVATVLCPRLTSASRCVPSPTRLRVRGRMQISPGNAHDFHIYARPIYLTRFRTGFGLCVMWPACPRALPHIGFLFVRPMFCYGFLQIPPRDGHPCRLLWRSPCRAASGLSPVSRAPCRAHHKKQARTGRFRFGLAEQTWLVLL